MKPKLPRALLWNDKTSMEEFLNESVNREMYDIFLKIKEWTLLLKDTEYSVLKIFNEVYYQCTKIVYEQNPNVQLRDYTIDIKSNMGSYNLAKVVYGLIYFLLSHRIENSLIDIKYCAAFLKRFIYFAENHEKEIFEQELGLPKNIYTIDLSPRPCAISQLDNILIDWKDVTNSYDKESILGVCNLYSNFDEKKRLLDMMQHAYHRFISRQNKTSGHLRDYFPFVVNSDYFWEIEKSFDSDNSEHAYVCRDDGPGGYPTYQELEDENINLKKKLEKALSENESLKSALNMTKPKKQQETSFTITMIVNYCKSIPEYSLVTPIEKMLYKFIRKCSENEEKLVDSISEHFNNKKYGDTVVGNKNVFDGSALQIAVNSEGQIDVNSLLTLLTPEMRNQIKEALKNNG